MSTLRHVEYYSLTETFDQLYADSKAGKSFDRLYDIIASRENILLAYRSIKSNEGSVTPGTDGMTIADIKRIPQDDLVDLIQRKLVNYQPKAVRRKLIPKENKDMRPLGIPCIIDRIIQQAVLQVLEPICEARFYNHSYGFRPWRSAHHALARVQYLVNHAELHYVVDIDIKGFFDNVNHRRLMKQLWNIGIQDRKVLRIIQKMIKAPIDGEGIPSKGTPQGGIISPLLSNIVLNDLDWWVTRQWENFPTKHKYSTNFNKNLALKKSRLKEGYIVRYADDFKVLCRDWKTAQRWFHAIRGYLKDRLKLDISPEKSKIVNLRRSKSDFLGFTIKATKKGKKRVAHTGIKDKKKAAIKRELRARIKAIQKSPTAHNAMLFNSAVRGLHRYFERATHVSVEMGKIAFDVSRCMYNRLKTIGKYARPPDNPPKYFKGYNINYRTFEVAGIYLLPIADVRHINNGQYNQSLTPYTIEGRVSRHKKLDWFVQSQIHLLMKSRIPNRSIEYLDNRISRYSMVTGKCEVTGRLLQSHEVHCHHVIPVYKGGTDKYDNLRILHKDIHILVHITDETEYIHRIKEYKLTDHMIKKLNELRLKVK